MMQSQPIPGEALAYIGASVTRPNAKRHLEGRGVYVDDIVLARLAHVVYLRSPMAHARIGAIDASVARGMPGIIAVVDGKQVAAICSPWVATLAHLPGMKSAAQYPLAMEKVCWHPIGSFITRSPSNAVTSFHLTLSGSTGSQSLPYAPSTK